MLTEERVPRQHGMVAFRMTLVVRRRRGANTEKWIKWWNLKKEDCCQDFRERLRKDPSGHEDPLYGKEYSEQLIDEENEKERRVEEVEIAS